MYIYIYIYIYIYVYIYIYIYIYIYKSLKSSVMLTFSYHTHLTTQRTNSITSF